MEIESTDPKVMIHNLQGVSQELYECLDEDNQQKLWEDIFLKL